MGRQWVAVILGLIFLAASVGAVDALGMARGRAGSVGATTTTTPTCSLGLTLSLCVGGTN